MSETNPSSQWHHWIKFDNLPREQSESRHIQVKLSDLNLDSTHARKRKDRSKISFFLMNLVKIKVAKALQANWDSNFGLCLHAGLDVNPAHFNEVQACCIPGVARHCKPQSRAKRSEHHWAAYGVTVNWHGAMKICGMPVGRERHLSRRTLKLSAAIV